MEKIKTNFIVVSLKKYVISILCIIFILALVLYSESNMQAVKEGLNLWATSVLPSLFPFFVATELLCNTNIINLAGKFLGKIVRKIFNVPGEGAIALIMGIISGYPTGAKIVVDFRKNHICTKEEAERLLAFTNNSGPLFIIGTVGISLFGNIKIGYSLLFVHIISCLIVGFIFRNWKKNYIHSEFFSNRDKIQKEIRLKDLGELLGNSIKNSIGIILNIGGFIVIFSVILSILNQSGFFNLVSNVCNALNIPNDIGISVTSGVIELTNGMKKLSLLGNSKLNIIMAGFLLGFGGLSVFLQVYSIVVKEGISIRPYFYGKLLQGIISVIILSILI